MIQDIKDKISKANKKIIKTEEWIEKIKIARTRQIIPFKDSKIERIIQNELIKLGILFEKHKHIKIGKRSHQADISIEPNIIIEINGCYWHGCPTCYPNMIKYIPQQYKNIIRDDVLRGAFSKDYEIIELWEHEVEKNLPWCMKLIQSKLECCCRKEKARDDYLMGSEAIGKYE